MRVTVFSTKPYDQRFLTEANSAGTHDLFFLESRLWPKTAGLAAGSTAVCAFVNDQLDAGVLETLHQSGTRLIALRCAGFNNIDLPAAERLGMTIARVPAYSPHAVAEHTVALILGLNRKTHRAYNRVREGNFALEGLLGFDLCTRTAGIVGTGRIGKVLASIMVGFGCRVVANDPHPSEELTSRGVEYLSLNDLFETADIVCLNCPLTPDTHHLIDADSIKRMRDGVMIINTGRGALIDARAVIRGLKSSKIGSLGLDVYEEEADLFFENLSDKVIQDDVFARLLTFPNVLITGHQASFTHEALTSIAQTTLDNITAFETGQGTIHRVGTEHRG
jgi:D-lactate dehydrogenase